MKKDAMREVIKITKLLTLDEIVEAAKFNPDNLTYTITEETIDEIYHRIVKLDEKLANSKRDKK